MHRGGSERVTIQYPSTIIGMSPSTMPPESLRDRHIRLDLRAEQSGTVCTDAPGWGVAFSARITGL